jgi:putative flippase GtrA
MARAKFVRYGSLLRKDGARPLRFALVGLAATFTHVGLAWLILRAEPQANPYLVNCLAYAVGFFVSYFGHRYLTFNTSGSMARFLLVAIGGFAINNLLVTALLAASASSFVAILVATAVVPVLTYVASALWVFKRRSR